MGVDIMQDKHRVIALLQEHGITPTQQRLEIARLLFSRPQHVSADQVLSMTRSDGRALVSKATVYNTLNLFARKGMIREIIVDPSKVFYDSNTSHHHHIYDIDNGTLSDVEAGDVTVTGLPRLPEGTTVEGVELVFRVRSAS